MGVLPLQFRKAPPRQSFEVVAPRLTTYRRPHANIKPQQDLHAQSTRQNVLVENVSVRCRIDYAD